eukprot:CAMPEP_0197699192 /NCGR_PEP_ID=MMETSP1338-20131121/120307_1 /TAXON_ID=43686 ORGANISM="Pelagodinium beii, Strain RCC1491" /NCGR_SAMPLE_ID=MMETSP1338 /ASSEMBLY_ACC=CAM_ASM_000754 /LENGTH=72 /DNA_ID=CAMNT_0043282655 /DNA_START=9 /DNA_END=224 /DNA_ORIENTATION=-
MENAHEAWCAEMSKLPGGDILRRTHSHWTSWTDLSEAFASIKRERPDLAKDNTQIRREAMRRACVEQSVSEE